MRKLWVSSLLLVLVAACGDDGGTPAQIDAPKAIDAAIDTPSDTPIDSAPINTNATHTLFLNTEGVTVTVGNDNAVTNTSSAISTGATLLRFANADAARATTIAGIVAELQSILAPYNITVTTTRPAAGPYHQIVLTDDPPTKVGFPAGTGGSAPLNCTPARPYSAMAFGFANVILADQHARVATTLAMFALTDGIPMSKKPMDCMCYADQACITPTAACTIGGPNTPVDTTDDLCHASPATMDEAGQFLAHFGPHP
jgi:hypothetical protein